MEMSKNKYPKITVTGLDNAGKTVFINRIITGEYKSTFSPTFGYKIDFVREKDYRFDFIDLGGHETFRTLFWENFVSSSNGCVFVFDRSNRERIGLAKEWLWKVVDWLPKNAILAFFANKSDLEDVMSLEEIVEGLNLAKLAATPDRSFRIFETSSLTGMNLDLFWEWMTSSLIKQVEATTDVKMKGYLFLNDLFEPIYEDNWEDEDNKTALDEALEAFKHHSLKIIDYVPYIDIGKYAVQIVRKGDFYGIAFIDPETDQQLARDYAMAILFEIIYHQQREKTVNVRELYSKIVESQK